MKWLNVEAEQDDQWPSLRWCRGGLMPQTTPTPAREAEDTQKEMQTTRNGGHENQPDLQPVSTHTS